MTRKWPSTIRAERWIAMQFTVQSHRLSTIGDQYLVRNLRQIDGICMPETSGSRIHIHLIQGEVGGLV